MTKFGQMTVIPFTPRKKREKLSQAELEEHFDEFLELARSHHRSTSHSPNEELHWKDVLKAMIHEDQFDAYNSAVIHFTGSHLEGLKEFPDGKVFVRARGYWQAVGAERANKVKVRNRIETDERISMEDLLERIKGDLEVVEYVPRKSMKLTIKEGA